MSKFGASYFSSSGGFGETPQFVLATSGIQGAQGPQGDGSGGGGGGNCAGGTGAFDDGSATEPSIFFESDPDTGIYRVASDSFGVAVGGSNKLTVDADGTTTNKSTCSTFQMTTGAGDGYALVSDASGNGSWTNLNLSTTTDSTKVGSGALVNENLAVIGMPSQNTAVGVNALNSLAVQAYCTAVGYEALANNIAGSNTAFGARAMANATSGATHNIAIGISSMRDTVSGVDNIAIGTPALLVCDGDENIAIGTGALNKYTGDRNVAIGKFALSENVSGVENTAVGTLALRNNTASNNTAVGHEALNSNTSGANNTAVGRDALRANISGADNTAVGTSSLNSNMIGANNVGVGSLALGSNVSGGKNTSIGKSALSSLTTGSDNTAVGQQALQNNNGSRNVAVGSDAGKTSTGSGNIFIGTSCLPQATFESVSGCVAIGDTAQPNANNQLAIGLGYSTKLRTNLNVVAGRADGTASHIVANISGTDYKLNVGDQGLPVSVSFGDNSGTAITSSADGSLAHGDTTGTSSIVASGVGSHAHGATTTTSTMTASGVGARCQGLAYNGGVVEASSFGTDACGSADGAGSEVKATLHTACARGQAISGGKITASGRASFAFGRAQSGGTITSSGFNSILFGQALGTSSSITSSGSSSAVIGIVDDASTAMTNSADASLLVGRATTLFSDNAYSIMCGQYGTSLTTAGTLPIGVDTGCIQIAGGSDNSNRDISVVIGTDSAGSASTGKGYADAWETTGADYAEFFEWADGNTGAEDRIGYFVKLTGDGKIEKHDGALMTSTLGIVSSTKSHTAFIADGHALKWQGAKMRDEFGRVLTEQTYKQPTLDVLQKHYSSLEEAIPQELIDSINAKEDTDATIVDLIDEELRPLVKPVLRNKINPAYDPEAEYIRRDLRPEWDPISLLGKVYVRQDGTCVVGQKCSINSEGKATSGSKYFVLEKVNDDVVRIFFK